MVCLQNPALLASRDLEIKYNILMKQNEVVVFSLEDLKNKELTGKSIGCLNLNFDRLRSGRFRTFKNEIQGKLGEDQNLWDRNSVIELRAKFADETITCHTEFADFIIWKLDNWLDKIGE